MISNTILEAAEYINNGIHILNLFKLIIMPTIRGYPFAIFLLVFISCGVWSGADDTMYDHGRRCQVQSVTDDLCIFYFVVDCCVTPRTISGQRCLEESVTDYSAYDLWPMINAHFRQIRFVCGWLLCDPNPLHRWLLRWWSLFFGGSHVLLHGWKCDGELKWSS